MVGLIKKLHHNIDERFFFHNFAVLIRIVLHDTTYMIITQLSTKRAYFIKLVKNEKFYRSRNTKVKITINLSEATRPTSKTERSKQ